MSEIENGRLGLYGAERSKCNHLMALGFKGLRSAVEEWSATGTMMHHNRLWLARTELADSAK